MPKDLKYPATFRELLNHHDFDWSTGRILHQHSKHPLQTVDARQYIRPTVEIAFDSPILDMRAHNHIGSQLPRLVAFDSKKLYFPYAYECQDTMSVFHLSPDGYLQNPMEPTPYHSHWVEKCPTLASYRASEGWKPTPPPAPIPFRK